MHREDKTEPTAWEPAAIPAEDFHRANADANINRAPYDRISGVLFKRAAHIKRVRYRPANPAPEMPPPWQGNGETTVRWLFSEEVGTAEGLLAGATFVFLHDTVLAPQAASGMQAHVEMDEVLYVIAGEGQLHHRPTAGSPVLARVLRPGDAVLIHAGELHRVENTSNTTELRLLVLGLRDA
jgi:mannose-6-phosphate isomerase-like protein (cupin superfamily)